LRIASWNINGLRARLDFLKIWLADRRPDVVGLQELKLTDEQFPHAELEKLGYQALTHGQKSWNGVAILAREPIAPVQRGLPGQAALGARLLTGRIGDLDFTTVYCPNGKHLGHEDYPGKLAWFDDLARHLREQCDPTGAAILCGDFNICRSAIDSWDEAGLADHIFHTADERQRLQQLLDWGLVDVYREIFPDKQAFSWWDYRGGAFHRKQGLRIDLMLATRTAMARVHGAEIDRDYRKKKDGLTASDHAPVWLDLK